MPLIHRPSHRVFMTVLFVISWMGFPAHHGIAQDLLLPSQVVLLTDSNVVIPVYNVIQNKFVGIDSLLISTDGGYTLRKIRTPEPLNNLVFADSLTGYATQFIVTGHSEVVKVYKTTDGGWNWAFLTTVGEKPQFENNLPQQVFAFSSPRNGFCRIGWHDVSGSPVTIQEYHTTDGGTSWQAVVQDTTTGKYDPSWYDEMLFEDENTGYVMRYSSFLKTTDGGEHWFDVGTPAPAINHTTNFRSNGHGLFWITAVELLHEVYCQTLLESRDTGLTWRAVIQTCAKVAPQMLGPHGFFDENHGIATSWGASSPNEQHILPIRTTDAGKRWAPIPNIPFVPWEEQGVKHLALRKSGTGLASAFGYTFCLARTTDYGATWNAMQLVVSTEEVPSPVTAVGPSIDVLYPNPVTIGTRESTIVYTIHSPSPVTIDVQDVLGRTIRRFSEGMRPPGMHHASLSMSGVTPGVHIVVLRAGTHRPSIGKLIVR